MDRTSAKPWLLRLAGGVALFSGILLLGAIPCRLQSSQVQTNVQASAGDKIPAGTLLPVILRTPFSFNKCKAGEKLRGKIAQEVLLPHGSKIKKGSTVEGRIAEVTPAANGNGTKISMVFDRVQMDGQWVPIVTDLRAIAGFMTVLDAQVPTEAPEQGTPYAWLPTMQIGGDSVFGLRGPVASSDDDYKVIGKFTGYGVLGQVRANESKGCRGAVDGNNHPQALWVFSSDACGVYGIENLKIAHAGRTEPNGTIVLVSETQKVDLRNGDGLLLRVD